MPENKLFCSWSLLFSQSGERDSTVALPGQSFQSAQQVSRQNLLICSIFLTSLYSDTVVHLVYRNKGLPKLQLVNICKMIHVMFLQIEENPRSVEG
jgi:hypothetical protein